MDFPRCLQNDEAFKGPCVSICVFMVQVNVEGVTVLKQLNNKHRVSSVFTEKQAE